MHKNMHLIIYQYIRKNVIKKTSQILIFISWSRVSVERRNLIH